MNFGHKLVRSDWAWPMGEGNVYETSLREIIKKATYEGAKERR